ncbi:MAG: TetR/AcrR family transcriptional regulator [Flavobacteriales bacterium]|nr:TetR/AcrR family transcriptional regulator [Flavobacteriales bacterium]
MSETRARIQNTAVALFNKKGFVNVTMRNLADELEMSLGNLTYHFKKKEALMEAIHTQISEERNVLLESVQMIPSIANIHQQMIPLLQLYERYRFLQQDMLEVARAYPHLAEVQRKQIKSQIKYIKAIIDYSVGSGNMNPETRLGQYQQLSETVWMIITFWLTQRELRDQKGNLYNQSRSAIWNLVIPLLTEKGMANFNQIDLNAEIQSV